jgi:eukaryotic-like serine/threonine-protein kinase
VGEESKVCTTCGRRFGDEAIFCPKDGTALTPATGSGQGKDAFLGREILGHIEIQSLIGSGAMGRVYRAHQRGIDRDVAVKILHKDLANNPDLVTRFLREAKVASRLNHPNVVNVLLAGQLDDNTMYLVMEYLDGISLHSALLAAGGALPLERALHVGLQVCDAVGQAHEAGVVHRDIKPENVMLIKRGEDLDFVKVLDFGIARLASGDPNRSGVETQAGLVFGTARYLSPEGAKGEPVGPPSDCYAIATVVYQAIAGRTPFESDSSVSLLVAQIHDPAPPLRSHPRASRCHPAIEAVIMKNLAKDPRDRDPDAHTFGRALMDAATEAGIAADDLIFRPAVARSRRSPSGGQFPVLGTPVLSGTSAVTPPAALQKANLISTQTALAPMKQPDNYYHPSYSGRPADGPPKERRVAKTMDDEETPAPINPAGTVAMSPVQGQSSGEESILGTASTPREENLPAGVPRRGKLAALLLVAGLVGVFGVGIAAYRLGWLGQHKVEDKKAEVDELVRRGWAAVQARRWEKPPGDNVVDITDKILALVPSETRAFQIRNAAADRIVREALDLKAHEDYVGALALYRLAAKLSPPDKGLQEETEEVEAMVAKDPNTAKLVTDGGAARFSATTRIGGDDPIKPNDPVTIVATITGETPKAGDTKAHFTISGPGLDKPKEIEARAETPTRYVGSFVFPQNGKYKVHFFARPENYPVTSDAERVVGAPATPPPKPTTTTTTKPTGGWPTKPVGTAPSTTGTIILTPDPVPMPPPTTITPFPPLPG